MNEQKHQLSKSIGFFPALTTVMGTVIGSGVFFKASAIAQATGAIHLHLLSWFLGGFISLCAGLTAAELAAMVPETGGMVKYIEKTYGNLAGFLLGWAQVVVYFPASMAALAIIFGTQFVNLFDLSTGAIVPVALIAAISITFINFISSKAGGVFQSVTLIAKLIPLFLIIIFGLLRNGEVEFSLLPQAVAANHPFFSAIGAGLLGTLFAYDGWIHVGNLAGEMKKPGKDLPKAITFGLLGVMGVYLLINAAFLMNLPINQIAGNANVSSEVASMIFGNMGGRLVTIGILVSVYGTLNGFVMTGMRLPYTLAKDKLLPFHKLWSKISPKTKLPVNAALLQLTLASLMMIFSSFSADAFNLLTDMVVFVIWIFYTLIFVAVFILRKREPDTHRPYKVPFYPLVPIIAIAGGIFILVMTLMTQLMLALTGVIATAIGIPVYFYMHKKYYKLRRAYDFGATIDEKENEEFVASKNELESSKAAN
ncbi:MAG: APC family permease [Streptococcaceae bacterium]|jgi:APA family basic amino acid/polyamine antiporter|nr:APC family permease [Streptococcaceae bacterium]